MRAAASRFTPRFLANSSRTDFDAFALPISGGSDSDHADQHQRQQRGHQPERAAGSRAASSSRPPRKKPTPFIAFLLPVNHATQRNSRPDASARGHLDGGLGRGLGQVLGDAADALRHHHPGDRSAAAPGRRSSADSIRKPAICVASPTASMRAMPKRVASQPPIRLARSRRPRTAGTGRPA